MYTCVHPVYPCVYTCVYLHTVNFLAVRISVHRKFMVGFSIKFNGKTNHKLPVTGYGKFERPRNSLYTCVSLRIPVYTCVYLHIPVYTCVSLCTPCGIPVYPCAHPVYPCVYLRIPVCSCVHPVYASVLHVYNVYNYVYTMCIPAGLNIIF